MDINSFVALLLLVGGTTGLVICAGSRAVFTWEPLRSRYNAGMKVSAIAMMAGVLVYSIGYPAIILAVLFVGGATIALKRKLARPKGRKPEREEELPYIGEASTKGIYRLVFPPQEGEFEHEDEARDAVCDSEWGNSLTFSPPPKVEFVRSTVTSETHPYECATCRDDEELDGSTVSTDKEGRCYYCGEVDWVNRT